MLPKYRSGEINKEVHKSRVKVRIMSECWRLLAKSTRQDFQAHAKSRSAAGEEGVAMTTGPITLEGREGKASEVGEEKKHPSHKSHFTFHSHVGSTTHPHELLVHDPGTGITENILLQHVGREPERD